MKKAIFSVTSAVALGLLLSTSLPSIARSHRIARAKSAASVHLMRVPDGGLQPQAIVDKQGVLHLVYYKGDPANGDLFYVHRSLNNDTGFSLPVRVNSRPHSAIALGTIRGAQITLGEGGRILVAWNGSNQSKDQADAATPMLFARSDANGDAFEPERSLLVSSEVIDGGGTVTADPNTGAVYVLWHAVTKGENEATGSIYLAHSTDNGATFAQATRIDAPSVGTCGCCGMHATVDASGSLYILYRAAAQRVDRDTMLLTSSDHGATFSQTKLHPWRANACPMSLYGLTPAASGSGVVGAWETQGQIYVASLNAAGTASAPLPVGPAVNGAQKYPTIAVAPDGTTLVAWVEGAGWQHGGPLVWTTLRPAGTTFAVPNRLNGTVPTWSLPAAVIRPDNGFVILY